MANVKIRINGKSVTVPEGVTILEAAKLKNVYIPTLCAMEGLKPKAACRLCMVNVKGEDKEKLACAVKVADGMVITTDSDELFAKRKALVENMFRQHTVDCHHCMRIGSTLAKDFDPKFCKDCYFCDCVKDGFCELQQKALEFGVDVLPFEPQEHDFGIDDSTGSVIRNMDKCIKCRRCVDICKAQGVGILGVVRTDKGTTVGAKNGLKTDGCIRCGRCVEVCPTGALFMQEHKDEVVYFAHQYNTETAAIVCSCVMDELQKLCKESFDYEQLIAAVKKLGVDHVYSPAYAQAQSKKQEIELLDKMLGKKPMLLTGDYAAKNYLRANFPELEESFAFYDSMTKCFGDYMHANHPGIKLIEISSCNAAGAEIHETGCADYFINARELYRILLRTGGRPAVKKPLAAEKIADYEKSDKYSELVSAGGWYINKPAEELSFTENGKEYKALLCHNLSQVKAAVAKLDKYDVIKIMA